MKDLEQYFDKAKKQEEIVTLEEVDNLLSTKRQRTQAGPRRFLYTLFQQKQFRYAAIAISAVLLGITIALVVQNNSAADKEVFIPQAQRRVFQLVRNISARPNNPEIRVFQFDNATRKEAITPKKSETGPSVKNLAEIPIHLRSKFELSDEQLKLMGFAFTEDVIVYEANVKGKGGYVKFMVTGVQSVSVTVDDEQRSVREFEFYPWFMTNENGFQSVKYRLDNEDSLKMTDSFFLNSIDALIPIQINKPGFKKVIFWFSQTPQLMDILESAAKVSGPTETNAQEDADKNTIHVEIFPTITKGEVQIKANALEKQKLEISLLNSSGEVLHVPVNNQELEKGDHNFSLDLSNYDRGLYFVRINSNPGVITIHRLLRE